MYKNEDEFVLGQKIKLGIAIIIITVVIIHSYITNTPILK